METIAKHRYARTSAQKARLVADLIRGKKVAQALEILTFTNKKAPSMKRVMPRAKGRADRILKRTSHITVVVSDR